MRHTIKDVFEHLNHPDFEIEGSGFEEYDIPFEIKPKDFITYAELDLNSMLPHKYVNALSNAKRSLDCQVTCLLDIFGLLKIAESKRWGFPTKIEALSKIGILAPKILNKINKARNILEHEFSNPNPDQVNDFIDIVTLFIESTRRYLDNYLNFIETSWINDKLINIEIIDDKIIVEIYYCENKNDESSKSEKIVVESSNENYYKLLDLFHKKTEGIY